MPRRCTSCRHFTWIFGWLLALGLQQCSVAADPTMKVHFIDVGQGAATLLEFPCGAMLIDTGAQDTDHVDQLIAYLKTFFDRRKDLKNTILQVTTTHPHKDHTWGLRQVAESFRVVNYIDDGKLTGSGRTNPIWLRKSVKDQERNTVIRPVSDEEITALAHKNGLTDDVIDPFKSATCDPQIRILSGGITENPGWSTKDFGNMNNHSVVTRVDFGSASFLFTGDLEVPAIQTLIAYYRDNEILDVDVWQVGHHGAANGTSEALLQALSPQYAFIGDGQWTFGQGSSNKFTTFAYGHPRLETIELLSQAVSKHRMPSIMGGVFEAVKKPGALPIQQAIFATGWDGTIVLEADLHGVTGVKVNKPVAPPDNEFKGNEDTDPNQPTDASDTDAQANVVPAAVDSKATLADRLPSVDLSSTRALRVADGRQRARDD